MDEYLRESWRWLKREEDQCPRLRVHPVPEVHGFPVGCMDLEGHAPGNACFF